MKKLKVKKINILSKVTHQVEEPRFMSRPNSDDHTPQTSAHSDFLAEPCRDPSPLISLLDPQPLLCVAASGGPRVTGSVCWRLGEQVLRVFLYSSCLPGPEDPYLVFVGGPQASFLRTAVLHVFVHLVIQVLKTQGTTGRLRLWITTRTQPGIINGDEYTFFCGRHQGASSLGMILSSKNLVMWRIIIYNIKDAPWPPGNFI